MISKSFQIIISHVHTADLNGSVRHIIQAGNQIHQRRLSGAGASDDTDGFSGMNVEIDMMQGSLIALLRHIMNGDHLTPILIIGNIPPLIGEIHIFKINAAVLHLHHRILRIADVGLLLKDLTDSLRTGCRHGQHDKDHRYHHQAEQNHHDVAKQRGQLAGCHRAANDLMRAKPRDSDDACIHNQGHHRHVHNHQLLCADEQLVQLLYRLVEFRFLIILTDKCLDDANGRDILLHTRIQVVIFAEGGPKCLRSPSDNNHEKCSENRQCPKENQTDLRTDHDAHYQCNDHHERRTDRNADNHHKRILQIRDVRRHTGDKSRRRILINIGERKRLDICVHGITKIRRKAGRSIRSKHPSQDTKQKTGKCHDQHDQTVMKDLLHVARLNSLVNQRCCHKRNQNFHQNFQKCKDRCQNRRSFILPDLAGKDLNDVHVKTSLPVKMTCLFIIMEQIMSFHWSEAVKSESFYKQSRAWAGPVPVTGAPAPPP